MNFGLTEENISKITSVFNRYPEIERVLIYGSRAKGNFKKSSDIDLTLIGEKINLQLLNKVELELDDLLLPYSFDISALHQISNTEVMEHISRVGMIFYIRQS